MEGLWDSKHHVSWFLVSMHDKLLFFVIEFKGAIKGWQEMTAYCCFNFNELFCGCYKTRNANMHKKNMLIINKNVDKPLWYMKDTTLTGTSLW